MKNVIISDSVVEFLDELVLILLKDEYFSFLESAEEYVNKLYDAIYDELPTLTHHETPNELKHHGKYYAKIKGSKRTMWYVFFNKSKNRFLVKFITNNHAPKSAYLQHL